MHLCVSLRWCTLHNGLQVWITGSHSILWDSMCQVGDFFFEKKLHFNGFSFRLCSLNWPKTMHRQWRCSSAVCEKTTMSSSYMRQYIRFSSSRQFCINCWNMDGALHRPKGMWSHIKKPRLSTVNAVYCFDNSSILICQNLDFRARHKKNDQHLLDSLVLPGS